MIGKLMQKQRLDGDVIIGTKDISIKGTFYGPSAFVYLLNNS